MKKALIILALIALIILVLFIHSNFTVGVTDYKLQIDDLPEEFDGYKILQLSDLHNSEPFGLMERIEEENPDIVVMTGDMVSSDDENFDMFLSIARKIAGKYTTYFIVGNHEQALPAEKQTKLLNALTNLGVRIIDNSVVELEKEGKTINLYGLWFNLRYYRDVNDESTGEYVLHSENIEKILGKPKLGVNILLTHNPVYFDAYAEWGADLTLAGHMHGGMIRVPFRGGLLSPEKEYFPEFDAGKYEREGSVLIVSRGLGQHAGFRFLNQPEIVVITLKK